VIRSLLALALALALCAGAPALAHETRPAYLEIEETGPETYDLLWKVPARGDLRLRLDVVLPPECEPASALRRDLLGGAFIDRWRVRCPGGLEGRTVHIAGLQGTLIDALVRVERADGRTQTLRVTPAAPRFALEASPSRVRVARTYLVLGVEHILGGLDHLLFVLGLLFLVRARSMLVKTITAFTVAHSITLAAATLGYAYPPVDTLNALIAMSILFLGPEIVRARRGETSFTLRRPWVVAFAFGLLHGFGFAGGLADLGLPRAEIPFALLAFNVGVEIGQLAFVALLLALGAALRVLEVSGSRWRRALPAYVVGSLGAAWTIERVAVLLS